MFINQYRLTAEANDNEPLFRPFAKTSPWSDVKAGLYNDGLVTIVDKNFDKKFMESWEWLIGSRYLLIAVFWDGSFVYVCSQEKTFYIVLVDEYKKYPMGNSLVSVFDKNIANDRFIKEILRPDLFEKYKRDVGLLEYGEMYTYSRQKNAPVKRSVSLFLDVAGQTGRQLKNGN